MIQIKKGPWLESVGIGIGLAAICMIGILLLIIVVLALLILIFVLGCCIFLLPCFGLAGMLSDDKSRVYSPLDDPHGVYA